MWRIWLLFDPRRASIGLVVFLAVLAFSIHFILLSTDRFNWIEGVKSDASSLTTTEMVAHEVTVEALGVHTA